MSSDSGESRPTDELIRFLGIDAHAKTYAELLWPLIQDQAADIIENFYVDARQPEMGLMLDDATIDRLKLKQKDHWKSLFSSQFDQKYFDRASLIGIKHREIGLDPKWYVAGYNKIKSHFATLIQEAPLPNSTKSNLIATLDKYVALDMALALSSYSSWLVE